ELVREGFIPDDTFLADVPAPSRTSPLVWLDLKGWWDEQFAFDCSNSTDRGRPRPTPSTKSADKECFVQATIETSLRLWVKPLQAVKP
ncbi:hypothetical protein RYA95_02090, partial [Pseudomonas syringae pv. actinidiae]|nr:hypothetical protein [Pseudomonas syringae pv. actinidiae]